MSVMLTDKEKIARLEMALEAITGCYASDSETMRWIAETALRVTQRVVWNEDWSNYE